MLNIAVCDDDVSDSEKLNKMLDRYFTYKNTKVNISFFSDGSQLLEKRIKFDLIFLDIEMKVINGIETAAKIRTYDTRVPIVYISNYPSFWKRAYKVHAFDFLEKPLQYDDLFRVMNDFIKYSHDEQGVIIGLNTDEGMIMQNANEICYFIVDSKRKINLHTIYKNYIVKGNLSDIYEKLDHSQFYRSHRCCIVNLKYVEYVSQYDIILKDNEFVPIAQKRKKEFLTVLHTFLRNN